ncbi:MAG: hypothetical protein JO148_07335, partial [Acidimicrobiia bacterium]|nr:hypothetical protein [Acidimicrobiia bacterium]
MDEQESAPEPHDPYGAGTAPEYARPEKSSRRTWMIAAGVGVVVLAVAGFFGVKALAGGGSSSTSTAAQAPAAGQGGGRRGTIGTLQSIDGSTLTVATFNRGGANGANGGGAGGAVGNTTTVTTGSSTKFYKTASGTLSDIKVGDRVTATGTPAGTNTVTAARITDTGAAVIGFGGGAGNGAGRRFRNGNNPNGTGNPPSSLPNGGTRPDPNSFANGTVKSISGTTLTVADSQGATKTVDTTGSTTYMVLKAVSINDLQTGQLVIIGGKTNSDGTVSATSVVQGLGGFGGGGG